MADCYQGADLISKSIDSVTKTNGLHGEMDALENAGRQPAQDYRESVLYTSLSSCVVKGAGLGSKGEQTSNLSK